MPNRILHESIKYCPRMEQLNWFEEVVYHRLTVTVDDYGCLDGRIVLLKNTLFPTREDISKDDIARAIAHLTELGLLRAYEVGGMPYLCFPAWEEEQRVRNKRRKFPAPPDAVQDEEEPFAAEDSLSAADDGALFAQEKHLTASRGQLTADCPPESNPYPYPDSNPKFESGSVTHPYPIQAPSACAEERPRAGEYEENGCGEACGGAAGNRASTPPAPQEDGQSLRRGCAAPPPFGQSLRHGYAVPPPFAQGRLLASAASCDCATSPKAPLSPKGSWRRSRLRGVLRIGLSNPKCGKRNSFPHFGRRWPGLSTLSGNARISLRFAQKALLERAGKLELFLQPAEGNRDHALLDALHHTCAGINVGFDMASLPCYRSN